MEDNETKNLKIIKSQKSVCFPLSQCWGILKPTKYANIQGFQCSCGMEVCIHCFIVCHKNCNFYQDQFNLEKTEGDPFDPSNQRNFMIKKIKKMDSDSLLFNCPCHDDLQHKQQKLKVETSDKSKEIFAVYKNYTCITCGIKLCAFCKDECHKDCKKPKKENKPSKSDSRCSCKEEYHIKHLPEDLKNALKKIELNDSEYKRINSLVKFHKIEDSVFLEQIVEKFYKKKKKKEKNNEEQTLEEFNNFFYIYNRLLNHYTKDMKIINVFQLSKTSIEYRLKARKENLKKYKKISSEFFIRKIKKIIDKVLHFFMKQKIEDMHVHSAFIFRLILYMVLDYKTVMKIFLRFQEMRKKVEKEEDEAQNELDKNISNYLSNIVDKLFFIIQIILRDKYVENDKNDHIKDNFDIIKYMQLMNFDNTLQKYRFISTIINRDSYYKQVIKYKNKNPIKNKKEKDDDNNNQLEQQDKINYKNEKKYLAQTTKEETKKSVDTYRKSEYIELNNLEENKNDKIRDSKSNHLTGTGEKIKTNQHKGISKKKSIKKIEKENNVKDVFDEMCKKFKIVGKEYKTERNAIKKYEKIEVELEIDHELKSAFEEFIKILSSFFPKANSNHEIRQEIYQRDSFSSVDNNLDELKNLLLEFKDNFYLKQMLLKIRHYETLYEDYLITFMSLYLLNEKTIKHLIFCLDIHKNIKGILSSRINTLEFVYNLLEKTKNKNYEFLYKSIFYYVSFIISDEKINNNKSINEDKSKNEDKSFKFTKENDERLILLFKILCLLNEYSNYMIFEIGNVIIQKMSEYGEFSLQIEKKNTRKKSSKQNLDKNEEENDQLNDEFPMKIDYIKVQKSSNNLSNYKSIIHKESLFIIYLKFLSQYFYLDVRAKEQLVKFYEQNIKLIKNLLKDLSFDHRLIIIKFLTNFITMDFVNLNDLTREEKFLKETDFEGCLKNIENELMEDDQAVVELYRHHSNYEKALKLLINEVRLINDKAYYKMRNCELVKELVLSVQKITEMVLVKTDKLNNSVYYLIHRLAIVFINEGKTILKLLYEEKKEKQDKLDKKEPDKEEKVKREKDKEKEKEKEEKETEKMNEKIDKLSIKIQKKEFEWEKPAKTRIILSKLFIFLNKKDKFLTRELTVKSYIHSLSNFNSPFDTTLYIQELTNVYIHKKDDEINKKNETNLEENNEANIYERPQYFSKEYSVQRWRKFVDNLLLNDYSTIFSFFDYFINTFNTDNLQEDKKYRLYSKIFDETICREVTINFKQKKILDNFEIINNMLSINTEKIQKLLLKFLKKKDKEKDKDKDKNKFENFIKNVALYLKENLFLYLESTFYLNSHNLAYRFQLLLNILDFLLKLKDEFCKEFVKYILYDIRGDKADNSIEKNDENQEQTNKNEDNKKPAERKLKKKVNFYSIYGILSQSFKMICDILVKTTEQSNNFPCERIVVLFFSISKFLKEYIEGSSDKEEKEYKEIKNCLMLNLRFKLLFIQNELKLRKIFLIKSQLLTLMTSIVFEYDIEKHEDIHRFFDEKLSTIKIWEQIKTNMKSIMNKKGNEKICLNRDLYVENEEFYNSDELKISISFFKFLSYWKGYKSINKLEKGILDNLIELSKMNYYIDINKDSFINELTKFETLINLFIEDEFFKNSDYLKDSKKDSILIIQNNLKEFYVIKETIEKNEKIIENLVQDALDLVKNIEKSYSSSDGKLDLIEHLKKAKDVFYALKYYNSENKNFIEKIEKNFQTIESRLEQLSHLVFRNNEELYKKSRKLQKVTEEIINKIFIWDNIKSDLEKFASVGEENITEFFILSFLKDIIRNIEISYEIEKKKIKKIIYFQIPPMSFNISSNSMKKFFDEAKRDSRHTKLKYFMENIDKFMFEIYCNNKVSQKGLMINYNQALMETINYFIIIANQILLIISFYKGTNYPENTTDVSPSLFSYDQKFIIPDFNVMIVCYIQMLFCLICFIFWCYLNFNYEMRFNYFKYKKQRICHLEDPPINTHDIHKKIHENIKRHKDSFIGRTKIDKSFKVIFIDTILLNSKINMILSSIILNLTFIFTNYALILSLQVLFICNLSSLLFFIIKAVKTKIKELISVLFFNFLIIYLFTWFVFYHLPDMYTVYDSNNMNLDLIKDNFCTTPLECYLNNIDFGTRSGGGIGDIWPKMSFKMSLGKFLLKMLTAIAFQIVIVLILGNIFMGIIVDAFAVLRDQADTKNKDILNNCFICNTSKEDCSNDGIDFIKHINEEHYTKNYIYFINYLLEKNPDEYNELENSALILIANGKTHWLPEKNN